MKMLKLAITACGTIPGNLSAVLAGIFLMGAASVAVYWITAHRKR